MGIGDNIAGQALSMAADVAGKLQTQINALRSIREILETQPDAIAVSDAELDPGFELDFPFPGARRATISRTCVGNDVATQAGGSQVVGPNTKRLGGSIVNKGATGVTLLISSTIGSGAATAAGSGGVGRVWLGPNGGAWDFRLANLCWCGGVYAIPDSGTPTLSIAEV